MARKPDANGGANGGRTDEKDGATSRGYGNEGRSGSCDGGSDHHGAGAVAPSLGRRGYMRFLGGSAAALVGLGAASATAAAAEYETITVGAGEQRGISLRDGDVLENVLIDVTADGADVRITARGDDWIVRNVGIRGALSVGRHGGYGQVMNCRGNGLIENVYLGDGVEPGADKAAMNTGNTHGGHIEMRNVHVAEWSSNAIYAAGFGRINGPGQTDGAGGTIAFRNCYFRDNNIAHLRLAADGTVVENCVIHNTNNVPAIPETHGGVQDVVNSRGIYTGYGDPGQVIRVENSDIDVAGENTCGEGSDHNYCAASAAVSGTHGTYGDLSTVRIVDSQVRGRLVGDNVETVDVGSEPDVTPPAEAPMNAEEAASGQAGTGGSGNPVIGEGTNTITVSGGSPTEAVEYAFGVAGWIEPGPRANGEDTVSGTTAQGAVAGGTDGFEFGGDVTDFSSTGEVTVRINGVGVDPATLAGEDSSGDGESGNEDRPDDGTGDDGSDDSPEEPPELSRSIAVSGGSPAEVIDYQFTVSEAVETGPNANSEDAASGTSAAGAVAGGTDDYDFAGGVTDFTATGEVTVTIDGEDVDPASLGTDDGSEGGTDDDGSEDSSDDTADEESPELSRSIALSGGSPSDVVEYTVSASEAIELGPNANSEDSVSGTTAQGALGGGTDDYDFAGEITACDATGDVTVTVDGEDVDPASLGTDDGSEGGTDDDGSEDGSDDTDDSPEEPPELSRSIAVSGGSPAEVIDYQFTVSEAVETGPNANSEDAASGTSAAGAVAGGTDDYDFAGDVTDFTATGEVTVTIDGEDVDPASLG